jgi:predicted  nucleic acid-binding Zn-ribbon protein
VIPATTEEQRRLYDLQQVDTAIRLLEVRRANLPEQQALDENAETLQKITQEFAAARERLDQLQRQQARLEQEIATVDSRRKSEEGRMYSGLIHSEKELEALRNELHSLKGRKRDLEDQLLEIMEELESLESLTATLQERHSELTRQVDELTAARDAAARDIDAELVQRRDEREKVADDVPAEMREHYEELREKKQGLAVAQLVGKSCSGCRLELTAIELEETREAVANSLAKCAQCGRILVLA